MSSRFSNPDRITWAKPNDGKFENLRTQSESGDFKKKVNKKCNQEWVSHSWVVGQSTTESQGLKIVLYGMSLYQDNPAQLQGELGPGLSTHLLGSEK